MKTEINFENICRTCSLEGNLQSLFNGNILSVSDMLTEIVDIKVIKDDNYPQNICTNCLDKLKSAYFFKKQCQEVNEKFEKYLKSHENLTDSVKVESVSSDSNDGLNDSVSENFPKLNLEYVSVKDENSTPLSELIIHDKNTGDSFGSIKDENVDIEQSHSEVTKPVKSSLIQHKRIHTEAKSNSRNAYDKTLNQRENLEHKGRHSAEKSYLCEACGKTFFRKQHLIKHTRIHTGEKPYSCDVCNKTFTQQYILVEHKRIHTGEKLYLCDVCDKTFTHQTSLVQHKRIHTGEKRFSCDVCDKTFANQSGLVQHKRTHTGDKPYSCDICDKTFTQQGSLSKHKRSHTREKLFSCDICDKTFNQQRCLNKHSRIHAGDKPFSCDICNKAFPTNYNLVRHKRIHNGKTPFS